MESQGIQITDDDVKTRGQKEKLEQITVDGHGPNGDDTHAEPNGDTIDRPNGDTDGDDDQSDKPKLAREGTMAVTAKVSFW